MDYEKVTAGRDSVGLKAHNYSVDVTVSTRKQLVWRKILVRVRAGI